MFTQNDAGRPELPVLAPRDGKARTLCPVCRLRLHPAQHLQVAGDAAFPAQVVSSLSPSLYRIGSRKSQHTHFNSLYAQKKPDAANPGMLLQKRWRESQASGRQHALCQTKKNMRFFQAGAFRPSNPVAANFYHAVIARNLHFVLWIRGRQQHFLAIPLLALRRRQG